MRCKNKSIRCDYTFKKRCGPKRRKGVDGAGGRGAGEGEGLLAPYAAGKHGTGILGFDEHLSGIAVELGKDEVECIRVFMQNLNSFLPLTTFDTVKLAAASSPQSADSGDDSQDEERNQLHHARKALLHGAIAVGAEFLDKEDVSVTHAGIARGEIKEWCVSGAMIFAVAVGVGAGFVCLVSMRQVSIASVCFRGDAVFHVVVTVVEGVLACVL